MMVCSEIRACNLNDYVLNDDNSITPTSNIVYEITYRLEDNTLSFEPLETKIINNEVFYCEKNPMTMFGSIKLPRESWQSENN